MATILHIDHRIIAGTVIAITSGVAIYSSYKYLSLKKKKVEENVYESKKLLDEYLVFHYAPAKDLIPYSFGPKDALDFPKRCADLCMKHFTKKHDIPCRALDIGCAVGRSSFEMTKVFDEVIGIDYSKSFIDACNLLRTKGQLNYDMLMVGDICKEMKAVIDPSIDRTKTIFKQGDACNLSPNLGQFGCVLAANLICRLYSPEVFLRRLASLVAMDGILVILSPYTFMREYTPREKWIGGYKDEHGRDFTGFEGLKHTLTPAFLLVDEEDMPFFIRETARKNQWTVAHATVWRRKS